MAIGKNLAGSFGNGGFLVNDNPNYWNARNQAAISSEKAYGNPAMNPSVATQLADQAHKGDPWYSLGRLIGAGYMQNWNERGINKDVEAGENALQGMVGGINGQQTQQANIPAQQSDNVQANWNYTAPQTTSTLGGLPVQYSDNVQAGWDPRDQMKKEKRDFFVNKYSGSPNPTSDGIDKANAEAQAKAEAERINGLRKLDPVLMYNLAEKAVRERGGTKYQQDMALAQIREKIGGYVNSANQQIFDYDSKEVEDLINKGEYEKANQKYAGLAARDKDRADMLFRGVPTLQQIWANKNQQAMMAARMSGYGTGGRYGGSPYYGSPTTSKTQKQKTEKPAKHVQTESEIKPAELKTLTELRDKYYQKRDSVGLSDIEKKELENLEHGVGVLSDKLGEGKKIPIPEDVYFDDLRTGGETFVGNDINADTYLTDEQKNNGWLLYNKGTDADPSYYTYEPRQKISLRGLLDSASAYGNEGDALAAIYNIAGDNGVRYFYNNGRLITDYKR